MDLYSRLKYKLSAKSSHLKEIKQGEEHKRGMMEAVQGVVIGVHITFAYARKLVAVQLLVPASRRNKYIPMSHF